MIEPLRGSITDLTVRQGELNRRNTTLNQGDPPS